MEQKGKPAAVDERTKTAVFVGLGALLIVMGFVITPDPVAIAAGLQKMILSLNLLDPNMFLVVEGALGATYVNCGILVLCVVASYRLTKCDINGGQIAAMFMVLGFAFCGKTIVNVWPILAGVLIFAAIHKKPLASMINIAWFSTALTPIFNTVAFYSLLDGSNTRANAPSLRLGALVLAVVLSLLAGYAVGFLAGEMPKKHGGYTLYNVGFAAGVFGFLLFSTLKVFGLAHDAASHEYPNTANGLFAITIAVILLYLGVCGLILGRKQMDRCIKLLGRCEKGGDAVSLYGLPAALVNMCVMGLIFLGYTFLVRGNLTGPLFAALFTAVGFAANGITPKCALPIMAGIFITSFLGGGFKGMLNGENFVLAGYAYAGTKNMLIAALYGCGMSPVTGEHGPIAGFFIGAIHSIIVPNTGSLHGWLCLYNNGFSMGLVTTLYTCFFQKLKNPWKEKQEVSVP